MALAKIDYFDIFSKLNKFHIYNILKIIYDLQNSIEF